MKKKLKFQTKTIIDNSGSHYQDLWSDGEFKPYDTSTYDSFHGKSFTQEAYEAGLPVQIGDDVIQKEE